MTMQAQGLRTLLGRVRGLGSAKEGTHHWWLQRVTAIALVPLAIWFVAMVIAVTGSSYADARATLAHPWNAVLLISTIIAAFYHAALGMQVVYEDYIHGHGLKIALDLGTKIILFALGVASILAVIKIALV